MFHHLPNPILPINISVLWESLVVQKRSRALFQMKGSVQGLRSPTYVHMCTTSPTIWGMITVLVTHSWMNTNYVWVLWMKSCCNITSQIPLSCMLSLITSFAVWYYPVITIISAFTALVFVQKIMSVFTTRERERERMGRELYSSYNINDNV